MTQRGIIALAITLFLVSLLFLLYEIIGFNWADTLLASDGGQIQEAGDSGKTVRVVFAALVFGFSFVALLSGICIVFTSNTKVSNIQEDMKTKCLNSLTEAQNRTHYSEHEKYGMKRVDLEDQFVQKGSSETIMRRITGLYIDNVP